MRWRRCESQYSGTTVKRKHQGDAPSLKTHYPPSPPPPPWIITGVISSLFKDHYFEHPTPPLYISCYELNGSIQFSSVQDGIYALGKAHMCSTLSLRSFLKVSSDGTGPQYPGDILKIYIPSWQLRFPSDAPSVSNPFCQNQVIWPALFCISRSHSLEKNSCTTSGMLLPWTLSKLL